MSNTRSKYNDKSQETCISYKYMKGLTSGKLIVQYMIRLKMWIINNLC